MIASKHAAKKCSSRTLKTSEKKRRDYTEEKANTGWPKCVPDKNIQQERKQQQNVNTTHLPVVVPTYRLLFPYADAMLADT